MLRGTGWGEEDQCGMGIGASKFQSGASSKHKCTERRSVASNIFLNVLSKHVLALMPNCSEQSWRTCVVLHPDIF
jgi:hypothetical protein